MSRILAGLAGIAMTLAAGPGLAQDITIIDLGYDVTLTIKQDVATNGVRIDIAQLAVEWQSVGIGNASFSPEDLQKVRLCADCAEVYFLSVSDTTFDDGVTTGVIAYERGPGGWSLLILPIDRPRVEDPDGDGIFTLTGHPFNADSIEYNFHEGLLSVAP